MCVPSVLRLTALVPERPIPDSSAEPLNIASSAIQIIDTQDTTSSELDDRFLIECPVCRTDLRAFGDDDLQAIHVATCLEGRTTSPSFGGGSRHLGIDGFFKLSTNISSISIARGKSINWDRMRNLL
jgi:hypothetical protein